MSKLREARRALSDCRAALVVLEDQDRSDLRRVLYYGILGVLRTVGDLLGKHGSALEKQVYWDLRERWKSEDPDESLFKFIDSERNQLIHEYSHSHTDEANVHIAVGDDNFLLDPGVFWPIAFGPFEGVDVRDALTECIEWWEIQLKRFEP